MPLSSCSHHEEEEHDRLPVRLAVPWFVLPQQETALHGDRNSGCARIDLQFGVDVRQVGADGPLCNAEMRGNFLASLASCYSCQDLLLAWSQGDRGENALR